MGVFFLWSATVVVSIHKFLRQFFFRSDSFSLYIHEICFSFPFGLILSCSIANDILGKYLEIPIL